MTKILVVGSPYMNYTDALYYALKQLGHDTNFYKLEFFDRNNLPKSQYLKWLINRKQVERQWYQYKQTDLYKFIQKTDIDIFIYFNGRVGFDYMNVELQQLLKTKGAKIIAWYMDQIKFCKNTNSTLSLYDEVYSFEKADIDTYKYTGITIQYLPIGVDEQVYCYKVNRENTKKYDLCFVGNPDAKRLELLENIAKYAHNNSKNIVVYGKYWNRRYKWRELIRRHQFRNKYPYLYNYVINETITPNETADLYMKSKICLNVHSIKNFGCNPRTFEILGNGNFELCDYRDDFKEFGLIEGVHLATYNNINDCIEKIDYYLKNDGERNRISNDGREIVMKKYTMKEIIRRGMNL